jgi:parvulin-like peptidyl-prolyl isomerase
LAALSVVGRSAEEPSGLPADAVARVGERTIDRADYQRALQAVTADRRGQLSPAQRRHVLDRLIDEELLVQYGIQIGLAARDPRVRADLSGAVLRLVAERGESRAATAGETELRAFYAAHRYAFRSADRVRLAHLYFSVADGAQRAEARAKRDDSARRRALEARRRLVAGESVAALTQLADEPVAPLPDDLVSTDVVARYLGPGAAAAAADLEVGEVSEPIRAFGGYHVFRVVERQLGALRPYQAVSDEVRRAYARWSGDRALKRFLDERRRLTGVVMAPEAP